MRITCGTVLAAALAVAGGAEARTVTTLNDGWTADGVAVTLPHCWNIDDGSNGPTDPNQWRHDSVGGTGYQRRRVVYRRALPEATDGNARQFVRVLAASTHALVSVDGQRLGEHKGAYTYFTFELPKGGRELEIAVDNFCDSDVPPICGDFTVFGGLYRGVQLIEDDANCDFVAADGMFADELEMPTDMPKYELRDDGFYADGRRIYLKGVNIHQDRKGKGWAISEQDEKDDLDLIKAMGANAIRTAHYSRSDHFYNLTDEMGFFVWSEVPLVDGVTPTEEFRKNTLRMAREMVLQNRRHKSIAFWSVFNELYCMKMPEGQAEPLVRELVALVKSLDPAGRPVVAATCKPEKTELNAIPPDGIGFNMYPGWYALNAEDFDWNIEEWRIPNNRKMVCLSEYGSGAALGHEMPSPDYRPQHNGRLHPAEYQRLHHETCWRKIQENGHVWGSFVWAMFDFAADSRTEGAQDGINDKGLVDYDHVSVKPAYEFYKKAWGGEDFTQWVDPFVGTQGDGNCFPGACRPFGMVQPSPDTGAKVHCGGYKFGDETIRGFSQTHLNGTGRPAMGDISILPILDSGHKERKEHKDFTTFATFAAKKQSEIAEPGYYAVTLEGGVKCEATATERVAVWRFTWPEGEARRLCVDAAAMLMQAFNAKQGATVPWAEATLGENKRSIRGGKKALGWTPYKLFYDIEFSEPWAKIEKLPSDPFQGKGDRWIVDFSRVEHVDRVEDSADSASLRLCVKNSLEVRIALSTVSEDGAEKNMRAEADGKSFEQIRAECRAEWNALLSRAQLVKGTDEQKKNWYTALYHLFIQPNIQTDVDGRYRGADDAIHVAKRGHYSTFSLWDTFRAAHPLYTILVPERVPGFVDSFIAFYEQHGHLPMWTMWQGEDHCMVGIHSIPVIVDAYKKGLILATKNTKSTKGEDGLCGLCDLCGKKPHDILALLVQSMINNDGENPKNCWNAYWENGYIPYFAGEFDKFVPKGQSVSTTLELAYDWWCIADFARAIGDNASAAKAQKWADCWRNVFDTETGFARPRAPKTAGGAWREPFDPCKARVPGEFWSDYTEATPWVYTWHVFQDPDALAAAMGGREKALAKLDAFFATLPPEAATRGSSDEGGRKADGSLRAGQIGQYWHGNEPSHHVAYLYSLWGRRDKTAALVKRICREAYRPAPGGLCGNDDCGQMSAWYLFSMMGFYPVNPCGDGYVLGEAQAEEIKLKVGSEGMGEFRIVGRKVEVKSSSSRKDENFTLQLKTPTQDSNSNVSLNGKKVDGVKISHEDIMRGGVLEFGDKEGI